MFGSHKSPSTIEIFCLKFGLFFSTRANIFHKQLIFFMGNYIIFLQQYTSSLKKSVVRSLGDLLFL